MWVHNEDWEGRKLADIINNDHENPKYAKSIYIYIYPTVLTHRYLEGVKLPENVVAVPELEIAVTDATHLIFVLPHQFLRGACASIKAAASHSKDAIGISLVKGMDAEGNSAGFEMGSDVIKAVLGLPVSVLSGANIANEVAKGLFCESTIGYTCREQGEQWKALFETPYFRLALVPGVRGVELCGALKNVIAMGAGFVDGLLMGDNTKAAIIRIGLAEMRRFIRLFVDEPVSDEIFFESCGLADLVTTCFGGRNRRIAETHVTTGRPIDQLEAELLGGQKLQGPPAAKEVHSVLAARGKLEEFPLMTAIYRICFEGYPADHVYKALI
jgi:glycerol-3-phosphate dehydrogenase (NAD+)